MTIILADEGDGWVSIGGPAWGRVRHTLTVVGIRRATPDDESFLWQMLAIAADWRPGTPVRAVEHLKRQPELAHYLDGWPKEGDVGFVAEGDGPIGAAWWRVFSEEDPGYGFRDESTPEISIGVMAEARGSGVGSALLGALMDEARRRSLNALSLSVDPANAAGRLYRRLGFRTVGGVGTSQTMVVTV
jgi:GNAT superfamily N-acetyltransferase